MENRTSSVSEIISNTKYTNVNVNKTNTNNVNVKNVRLIADKLATALNDRKSFEFFCKIAWRLPEVQIWNNLEQSAKGRNQTRLFTWLCQQDMK